MFVFFNLVPRAFSLAWGRGNGSGNEVAYSRYWTGTSLQLRLMRGVFSNVNDIYFFLMIFSRMSLHCKLVPVQYREYECGPFAFGLALRYDWLKKSRHFIVQLEVKSKNQSRLARTRFSAVHVSYMYLLGLPTIFVIGQGGGGGGEINWSFALRIEHHALPHVI